MPLTPAACAAAAAAGPVAVPGAGVADPVFAVPLGTLPSFSDGGVCMVSVPPGNESDEGAVKARACAAVDGCELSESIEDCEYSPGWPGAALFTTVTEDDIAAVCNLQREDREDERTEVCEEKMRRS